jgi:hypothetical protein
MATSHGIFGGGKKGSTPLKSIHVSDNLDFNN